MAILIEKAGTEAGKEIRVRDMKIGEYGPGTAAFTDDDAVALVKTDANRAEAWIDKFWGRVWREADILYQAPRSLTTFEGTTVTKANVSRFIVATHVNSVTPKMVQALFYQTPPFELKPSPAMDMDTMRAWKVVLWALLRGDRNGRNGFKQEIKRGMEAQALFGTAIWAWGVEHGTKQRVKYVRKKDPAKAETPAGVTTVNTVQSDKWDKVETTVDTWRPWLKRIDHRYVLTSPDWNEPDIRESPWVDIVRYMNYYEIMELANNPAYDNFPAEAKIRELFEPPVEPTENPGPAEQISSGMATGSGGATHAAPRYENTSADPLMRKLRVDEYQTDEITIVVLQHKLCLRNNRNEFGVKQLYSANWWNVNDSGYGLGLGRIIGQDQRIDSGVTNWCLDVLAMQFNADYLVSRGANVPTQQQRQRLSGITVVDGNVREAVMLKPQPQVPNETFGMLQLTKSESENASGANEQATQGGMGSGGRTSLGRTATGAGLIGAAVGGRIQGPIDAIVDQVLIPHLYRLIELVKDQMPMEQLREILGQEMESSFKLDEEKFLNAEMDCEVLAGALLAARTQLAQWLPLAIQMFENPALMEQLMDVAEEYVDIGALFRMMVDMSGLPNPRDVIKKMTEQMKQKRAAANPAMAKIKGQMMLENQRAGNKAQQIDQQAMDRAAGRVLEKSFETPELQAAMPGGAEGSVEASA
jgi:hypothetical protein